ncbi:MAG: hypothetical protein R3E97_24865, partial [Candidatus Eisenbacteria bacterium]
MSNIETAPSTATRQVQLVLGLLISLAVSMGTGRAETWEVCPGEYTTISGAMEMANPPDTVLVCAGTYPIVSPIEFKSGVTLLSRSGRDSTMIVLGSGSGRLLTVFGNSPGSRIGDQGRGFTFMDGAPSPGESGGAIHVDSTGISIADCAFVNNHVTTTADVGTTSGGAIYAARTGQATAIVVSDCLFGENYVSYVSGKGSGGAVALVATPNAAIENCTFVENRADCTASEPEDCFVVGNARLTAGAVATTSCDGVSITDCSFIDNSSMDGGAVQVWFPDVGHPRSISRNHFERNYASRNGGAFVFDHHDWGIEDCSFFQNSADSLGGSVFVLDTTGYVRGCTFESDSVSSGAGGSVAILETGGTAESDTFAVENCRFVNSYAVKGGAISLGAAREFRISECSFEGTSASMAGGAIHVDNNDPVGIGSSPDTTFIVNCEFRRCSAPSGGAVFIDENTAVLEDCLVIDGTGVGAGVYWRAGGDAVTWSNLTFAFCAGSGAALFLNGGERAIDLTVEGSIFAYNSVGLNQTLVAVGNPDSVNVSFSCCDSFGNVGGNGTPAVGDSCFVADPDFCWAEPDSGTFTLSAESPCLPGLHPNGKECGLIGARGQGCWVEEFTSCDGTWLDEAKPLSVNSTSDTLRVGAYADSAVAVVRFASVDLP